VSLIEIPETFIRDFSLQLNPDNNKQLLGSVALDGPSKAGAEVRVIIPGLKLAKTVVANSDGIAEINMKAPKIEYWSPASPKLYAVGVSAGRDSISDTIGFRTIATRGTDILLNGEPVFLRGISMHEESPLSGGRANSEADAALLLGWVKELNCNFVRLAHYPHNEHMVRAADKLGIMVWEENPVYWTIQWQNPETFANAEQQLAEVISRDKNRASVVIWSMANETPNSDARMAFLSKLAKKARSLDHTRLISAALEQSRVEGDDKVRTIDDPFAAVVDVLSFNQYVGWYDGLPAKAAQIRWEIEQEKPVIVSEFGAGAKFGFHADPLTRWSEEYQESLYTESLKMLDAIEPLRGMSPWVLMDFRSPRRQLSKIQDGYNRKGLIDEHGNKKKAFYILQKYYARKAGQ
jgi:beta-glucuronidase